MTQATVPQHVISPINLTVWSSHSRNVHLCPANRQEQPLRNPSAPPRLAMVANSGGQPSCVNAAVAMCEEPRSIGLTRSFSLPRPGQAREKITEPVEDLVFECPSTRQIQNVYSSALPRIFSIRPLRADFLAICFLRCVPQIYEEPTVRQSCQKYIMKVCSMLVICTDNQNSKAWR